MLIKSRTDAIKYLNQHGYRAIERDWILGQSIGFLVGPQTERDAKGVLYIYPSGDQWAIYDVNHIGGEEDNIYPSLQDAVIAADDMACHYDIIQSKRYEILAQLRKTQPPIDAEPDPAELIHSYADMVNWYTNHPSAGKFLFRSEDEMRKVWIDQGGIEAEMPKIDFAIKMVVAIFVDEGTYKSSFGIRSVKKEGNRIKVFYREHEKAWKMINPCSVFEIDRAEGEVEFIQIN